MITQNELLEYRQITESLWELEAHKKTRRENLLARRARGEREEPGALQLHVTTQEFRTITRSGVVRVMGEAAYERLRQKMPLSKRVTLKVDAARPEFSRPSLELPSTAHLEAWEPTQEDFRTRPRTSRVTRQDACCPQKNNTETCGRD